MATALNARGSAGNGSRDTPAPHWRCARRKAFADATPRERQRMLAELKSDIAVKKAEVEANIKSLDEKMAGSSVDIEKVLEESNAFLKAQDEWFAEHKADRAGQQQKFDEDMAALDARIAALKELIEDFVDTIYDSFDQNRNAALEFSEVHEALKNKGHEISDVWEIFGRTLVSRI